jgi:hypothetical protein
VSGSGAAFLREARERLPFLLPDFNRQSWVGEHAREVWAPRIARIALAWLDIEWRSVAEGARDCALIWLAPDALPRLIPMWEAARLSAIQLETAGAHFGGAPASLPPGLICVAVGDLAKLDALRKGWIAADNDVIGRLLGYPACCRAAFCEVWLERRETDTTWSMAQRTCPSATGNTLEVALGDETPPLANILWRWIGVRAVPHLPCRFDCPASIAFGARLLATGRTAGYAQEVEWIDEILRWPVEWSALHGIAEIKSPLLKVAARTDATAGKWVVRWNGTRYPEEGAVGLKFPYQPSRKPMLTRSRGFQQGLAHGAKEAPKDRGDIAPPPVSEDAKKAAREAARDITPNVAASVTNDAASEAWRYADNGFASEQAMDELHRPIVTLARAALANARGNVIDLGCGNGLLLSKICDWSAHLVPHGIDSNASAIRHAQLVHPQFTGNFTQGDLFDTALWDDGRRRYVMALIMIGRLIEVLPERSMRLIERLRACCTRVLGYAYPDWREAEIDAIAQRYGLALDRSTSRIAGFLKEFEDQ